MSDKRSLARFLTSGHGGYLDKAGIRTALIALHALAAQVRALLVVSKSVPRAAVEADRVLALAGGRLS